MIKESKHCTDAMKKHFNKGLVMTCDDLQKVGFATMITLIMMLK